LRRLAKYNSSYPKKRVVTGSVTDKIFGVKEENFQK
jgi:hypothetical protein